MEKETNNNLSWLGELIKEEAIRQKYNEENFGKKIGRARSTVNGIYHNGTADLDLLTTISKVLKHNFVKELTDHINSEIGLDTDEEPLDTLKAGSLFDRDIAKILDTYHPEYPSLNRELLKETLNEYLDTKDTKPMLIIERGYTFGATEVLHSVVNAKWRNNAIGRCRKIDGTNFQSCLQKIFYNYFSAKSHDTGTINNLLYQTIEAQKHSGKHFVNIWHLNVDESVNAIYETFKDDFICLEYKWDGFCLRSWAKEYEVNEKVQRFIFKHHVEYEKLVLANLPAFYPTLYKCSLEEWIAVSDYFKQGEKINKKDVNYHTESKYHMGLIEEIKSFCDEHK